jgi:hypothetical protein
MIVDPHRSRHSAVNCDYCHVFVRLPSCQALRSRSQSLQNSNLFARPEEDPAMNVSRNHARLLTVCATMTALALAVAALPCSAQTKKVVDLGLSKNGYGDIELSNRQTYKCKIGDHVVEMLTLNIGGTLTLSSADCDETPRLFNGRLQVKWEVTARAGSPAFGHVNGHFVWTDGDNRVEGTIEGTLGCGTHRPPMPFAVEHCRDPYHLEGLIKGAIVAGKYKGGYVQASYAGILSVASPTATRGRLYLTLDGANIQLAPVVTTK